MKRIIKEASEIRDMMSTRPRPVQLRRGRRRGRGGEGGSRL